MTIVITRRLDRTLIKLLMALLLLLVAAQGNASMFNSEPANSSLNCAVMQGMQPDTQADNSCPDIDDQIVCSISCAASYAGVITNTAVSPLALVSPQHDRYVSLLGRLAVAPDPFPPKLASLC